MEKVDHVHYESEKTPRSFTQMWKNKQGEILGGVKGRLDQELSTTEIVGGMSFSGHELLSCEIEGPDGTFDLLSLVQSHGVRIVMVDSDTSDNYIYVHDSKTAYIPKLRSVVALSFALHEIGHAEQFHAEYGSKLSTLARLKHGPQGIPSASAMYAAREVITVFREKIKEKHFVLRHQINEYTDKLHNPTRFLETAQALRDECAAQVAQIDEGATEAPLSKERLEKRLELQKVIFEQAEKIERYTKRKAQIQEEIDVRLDVLKREVPELFELEDIFRKMLEYDATRRAHLFLSRIQKQTGINVYAEVEDAQANLLHVDVCAGVQVGNQVSPGEVKKDSEGALHWALSTYGATTEQLRHRLGAVPHFVKRNPSKIAEDDAYIQKVNQDIEDLAA